MQLEDIDLIGFNRKLKYLYKEDFLDDELWNATKYMTETFLPQYFDMQGMQRQLPPSRFMPAIQMLISIYGEPLKMKKVDIKGLIDTAASSSRMETSSVLSNMSEESIGLSSSFKKLMQGQKLEHIPIRWGHGGQALFGGPGEVDVADDVLAPGKTYHVRMV